MDHFIAFEYLLWAMLAFIFDPVVILAITFEPTLDLDGIVPDYESRDRDVVSVRRTTYFGETPGGREFGVGRDWKDLRRGGEFTSNLGPRWTGSHHTKGGIPSK
jgi:hypothetical protein